MKAILIDPHARTVQQIDLAPGIDAIYAAIGADCFCTLNLGIERDAIFLDDDGLFKEGQEFFALGQYPNPLAGKGVILGCTEEGESCDAVTPLELVRLSVHWLTPHEAVQMNRDAAAALETRAAIDNASQEGFVHIVHAPLLEIDEGTGKARAA
jgi:hypothetical protein